MLHNVVSSIVAIIYLVIILYLSSIGRGKGFILINLKDLYLLKWFLVSSFLFEPTILLKYYRFICCNCLVALLELAITIVDLLSLYIKVGVGR